VPFQRALHLGTFVRGIVVRHQLQLFVRRCHRINHAQEFQPFLMAMALLTDSDHGSIERIQCGEQRGRPVALVVVRHGPRRVTSFPFEPNDCAASALLQV
jgi:hypothetical protein